MFSTKRILPGLVLLLALTQRVDAACTSPAGNEGDLSYNGTYHVGTFCNGTNWVSMGSYSPSTIDLTSQVTGTLPVGHGGTGTGTAFTPGSVVFAGASGIYSQDNANFFWDATNHRLGLGATTPQSNLSVSGGVAIGTTYANTNAGASNNLIVQGNVGIGTTLPSQKLEISAPASVTNTNAQSNISAWASNGIRVTGTGNNNNSQDAITYQSSSNGGGAAIAFGRKSSGWQTFIDFYAKPNSGGTGSIALLMMRLDGETGYVGIGSTSPVNTLDVTGTGIHIGSGVPSATTCRLANNGGTLMWNGSSVGGGGGGSGTVTSSTAGQVAYYQSTGTTVIGTSTLNIIGGQVGVGTATFTQPLTVNGNIDAMGSYSGYITEIPNSSTATVANKLAKMYGANTVAVGTTGDTDGMIGVVVGGAGTTGSAQIAIAGQVNCAFDSTPTMIGDWVTISSTTAEDCHDSGTKTRSGVSGQIIG